MTRPSKKNAARPARGRRNLSAVSAAELQAELARRQKRIHALTRRHERLLAKAVALRAEITALGGQVTLAPGRNAAGTGSRPRNETNLVEALKRVLAGKAMTVAEATRKVLEAGYQTTSPSFRQIVNITLIRSDQFQRVGRGKYAVK